MKTETSNLTLLYPANVAKIFASYLTGLELNTSRTTAVFPKANIPNPAAVWFSVEPGPNPTILKIVIANLRPVEMFEIGARWTLFMKDQEAQATRVPDPDEQHEIDAECERQDAAADGLDQETHALIAAALKEPGTLAACLEPAGYQINSRTRLITDPGTLALYAEHDGQTVLIQS